ncbi:GntR family transcriptional regulator [Mariniflexile sp. HNIBRBA6329]|uniref:GntR family transcriptional regulator n=1 Tax=Mariniflexile sp. HNIBRBA6329 TaxID=3373088 RepID=UPI0037451B21
MNLHKDLNINLHSKIPKYLQIVDCIAHNISKGEISRGAQLPSINAFSKDYCVSRDTVEKAYRILKDRKIIEGKKGKGTYVSYIRNELKIYKSYVKNINTNYHLELKIYNCDESTFLKLMEHGSK